MAAPHSVPLPAPDAAAAALLAAKTVMRRAALACRATLDPEAAGAALAARCLAEAPPPLGAIVAGFWPIGSELDIRLLMRALAARGHTLALPVTPARGAPLRFHTWRPGDPLSPGPLGTSHPAGGDRVTPDWLLVPLLAFDRAGNRLGYGGGYYDRTLAEHPHATAIGVAYAAQEVPGVPAGPTDHKLRRIATEAEIIRCVPVTAA